MRPVMNVEKSQGVDERTPESESKPGHAITWGEPLLTSARVKNGLLLQDKGAQRSSARWEFNPQNTQKKNPPSGTMKQRLSKSS